MAKENNFHHTETEISEGFGSWHLPLTCHARQRPRRCDAALRPGQPADPGRTWIQPTCPVSNDDQQGGAERRAEECLLYEL